MKESLTQISIPPQPLDLQLSIVGGGGIPEGQGTRGGRRKIERETGPLAKWLMLLYTER